MKSVRSLLFVPAHERDWVETAPPSHEVDALVFDIEDAVPGSEKGAAREILETEIPRFEGVDVEVGVRINPARTEHLSQDLDRVVCEGLDFILVPKVEQPEDLQTITAILTHLETVRSLSTSIDVVPVPETATGFYNVHDIVADCDRVTAFVGSTSPGGDVEHALDYSWTHEGRERLHLRSKVVLDARAAGIEQLFTGPWTDVNDIDGLRIDAKRAYEMGYTGYAVIHPDHVGPVNEIFRPSQAEIDRANRIVDAATGDQESAAIEVDGEMIDTAHVKRARDILTRAQSLDLLE
ncbi:HpcH/HpaI aldolase/citrate lyase family protein [Halobacteriales archaeon Cl-PHB]